MVLSQRATFGKRPSSYPFLQHRWQHEDPGQGQAARLPASSANRPVRVAILRISGQVLPDTAEGDADGGELGYLGTGRSQDLANHQVQNVVNQSTFFV